MTTDQAQLFAAVVAASVAVCLTCVLYCLITSKQVASLAAKTNAVRDYTLSVYNGALKAAERAELSRATSQSLAEAAQRYAMVAGDHCDEARENREQAREYRDEALLAGPTDGSDGGYVG